MFSTLERLKKHTPKEGIGREEYIRLLADEYYETENLEAKQQVTANLSNFAYDPINFPYLRGYAVLDLFFHLLTVQDSQLKLHGIAGICNLAADEEFRIQIIASEEKLQLICNLLNGDHDATVLNALTTLLHLQSFEKTKHSLDIINHLKLTSDNVPIKTAATLYLEESEDTNK